MQSLKQNNDLKRKLVEFYSAAADAVCRDSPSAAKAFREAILGQKPSRLVSGVMFDISPELNSCFREIIQTIALKLDAKLVHEKEVGDALWEVAADVENGAISREPEAAFWDKLDAITGTKHHFIQPDFIFEFEAGLDTVKIGPANVWIDSVAVERLGDLFPDHGLKFTSESEKQFATDGTWLWPLERLTWQVDLVAAQSNVAEEAAWIASQAISLLRLEACDLIKRFPHWSEVEPHPFGRGTESMPQRLVLSRSGANIGSGRSVSKYLITRSISERLQTPKFLKMCDVIFAPPKGSVAASFAQGLGWLAKGRQSHDRAERFLFFFTAIEALLSEKDAPLTDSISRSAGTILHEEPEHRAKNAALIKRLYGTRSKLVHAGSRNVSHTDANTIHHIAEDLYSIVYGRVDLTQKRADFLRDLRSCSFGLPWRQKGL